MRETRYRVGAGLNEDLDRRSGNSLQSGFREGSSGELHLTIALLSDFHNSGPATATAVTDSLRRHRPDIIAIAGDLLVGYRPRSDELMVLEQKNVLPLVRACADIAPTYVSLGNHEWMVCDEDIALLKTAGATVLNNRFVATHNVAIGGLASAVVSDFEAFRQQAGGRYPYKTMHSRAKRLMPDTAWLDEFEQRKEYKILLSHHPEYWSARAPMIEKPMLEKRKFDLVLSGHAHGGQIRLFGRGLYAPNQGWLPEFTGGVHRGDYGCMVVSRGLSNTAPVPRLFNPTEIVYIEI